MKKLVSLFYVKDKKYICSTWFNLMFQVFVLLPKLPYIENHIILFACVQASNTQVTNKSGIG